MKKFNSFRNRQNGFEDLGSGTAEAAKTKKSWWKVPGIILVILVIAIFAFNSTYQIREQEQAVLITLGQAKAVTDPGLHFKIPFIQQVRKVNTTIQGFSLGYDVDSNSSETDDSLMITSDYNFVNVDFFVEYRFSDPVKAVYASKDPVLILRNISQSCIRTVIGSYPVDDVLTTGKNEIQAAIKEMILERLSEQDIGIQLVNITIQDSEPPTSEVMEAFKAVETAKQGKETALNNANKYRNEQLPLAQAQADGIIKTLRRKRPSASMRLLHRLRVLTLCTRNISRTRPSPNSVCSTRPWKKYCLTLRLSSKAPTAIHRPSILWNPSQVPLPLLRRAAPLKLHNNHCLQKGSFINMKKVKNISLILLVLALLIIGSSSIVVTNENEYSLIRQFGKVDHVVSSAGVTFKIPFVQSVDKLPKEILLYDLSSSDVITSDKKTMICDSYILWQINDPLKFAQTLNSSISNAESRLDTIVYNSTKNIISSTTQNDVISGRDGELAAAIMKNIGNTTEQYGIELLSFETKQLDLPSDNKAAVYERMISERENISATYTAEGSSEAQKIRNTTDKEVNVLLSEANKNAEILIAEGEAEYMRILSEAYSDESKQDFYSFVRSLDALKASMTGDNKTVILSPDSPIAQIFYGR